jgi:hypothetical protein
MKENAPTLEQWRTLYDVWDRVKIITPWEWMLETNVFGVQNPDQDEIGFVSVMGNLGEHYAVAVYLGSRGLYGFWNFQMLGPTADPMSYLTIPQIQASFEDRAELTDQDRGVIKSLGRKYRGAQAWPQFRCFRPGFMPWYLEADEAQFLTVTLEQVLNVAPRFRLNTKLLPDPSKERYLVRVPRRAGDTITWEDQEQRFPPPESTRLNMPMDTDLLEHVKSLPQRRIKLEIDLFMLPSPTQEERGSRPFFPYTLLTVDTQSGTILGMEMLAPEPTLESIWERVPLTVLEQFAKTGIHPDIIYIPDGSLVGLLQRLASELNCRLMVRRNLRHMESIKAMLMTRF